MTDEEIAKVANEKANEKYPVPYLFIDLDIASNRGYKQGFINGVKYGCNMANKWHDLRKFPDDLPPLKKDCKSVSISVLTNEEEVVFYSYKGNCWLDFHLNRISPFKAWCEIPKFNEDVNNEM
jgi:hypothetical protein